MSYEQFSSFQIGKMLNVSRQAVNQWIDKGYIHSYRTPGGHRRVRRDDLLSFLKTRNIPVPPSLSQFEGAPAEAEPQSSAAPAGPVRVMLLDDDRDFTTLLVSSLKKQFPQADFVAYDNGFDALVGIGTNPPTLLTLDLRMPNMNGLEICRRLRDNPATREIAIMIVTAHDTPEWRDALSQLGITAITSKSSPFNEIVETIAGQINAAAAA